MRARGKFIASRFAYLAWNKGRTLLVSPVNAKGFEVDDERVVRLVSRFREPLELSALAGKADRALAATLIAAGVLVAYDGDEVRGSLASWDPHAMIFHTSSRLGAGRNFRFLGVSPPEPMFPARGRGAVLRFSKPNPKAAKICPTLWQALEARESVRSFSNEGPSFKALGELLFYTARNKETYHDAEYGESGRRNYPSGGGLYPLEIHLLVPSGVCKGLGAGVYRYRPDQHALERIGALGPSGKALLGNTQNATELVGKGWVLFAISARVARTSWKYEEFGYSLILKEVGCLVQTLYLAATALGLGACAVGTGSLDLLSQAAKIDRLSEPQVGEMVIGRRS